MRDFQMPGRSPVFAQNGLCATSHPLAAKVAIDMLQAGGNAVDAAIAGAALLSICEPQMCGIGGDMFALVHVPGRKDIVALNGSGRAPAAFDAEALRQAGHDTMPADHVAAVTLPGAIDGFCRLSEDFGRQGIAAALAPALHYAEEGVPVAPRVAFDWARTQTRLNAVAQGFYLHNGAAPNPGTVFRQPGIATALRAVAEQGRDGFYTGPVAEDLQNSLAALGGAHTLDDFAAVESTYVDPVTGTYRDITLVEHPPNSHGATAILMGHILAQFDLAKLDPLGADRAHLELEASKLAYDARDRFLGDFDQTTRLDHMLNPDTGAKLAALIDPNTAAPHPAALSEAVHKDTIYITVVDKDRMAVSLIYSVFNDFGSGMSSEKYGILFHNRGAGFNLTPGHPNEAGPGKRPMHTIIPAMTTRNGLLETTFGVMGGQYQPCGHMRYLSNAEDFGMDPQAAIDAPRLFAEPGGPVRIERGYADTVRNALAEKGHALVDLEWGIGGAQAIRIDPETGVLEGGSDPRKDGCALGY